jgi:hypothetical protein
MNKNQKGTLNVFQCMGKGKMTSLNGPQLNWLRQIRRKTLYFKLTHSNNAYLWVQCDISIHGYNV